MKNEAVVYISELLYLQFGCHICQTLVGLGLSAWHSPRLQEYLKPSQVLSLLFSCFMLLPYCQNIELSESASRSGMDIFHINEMYYLQMRKLESSVHH